MAFIDPAELPAREIRPGWTARFFHSEHMTFAYYEIAGGAGVHRHSHDNEEVWHVVDGALEATLGDAARPVPAGTPVDVPGSRAGGRAGAIVVAPRARDSVGGVGTL